MEDLCYRRLLDHYYLHEKPIENNISKVARLLLLSGYEKEVEQVLSEFFELSTDGWVNHRADVEIQQYQGFKSAGAKGAAIRWGKGGDNPPNSPPKQPLIANNKQEPITNNQEQKTKSLITLGQYIEKCKEQGVATIPENDKVFEFAENANIPMEFLRVGWIAFRDEFVDKPEKKQKDWVVTFRTYVRNDYLKVWSFNKEGECYLTTKGKQIQSDMEKKQK